jgi:hypothetical protein
MVSQISEEEEDPLKVSQIEEIAINRKSFV